MISSPYLQAIQDVSGSTPGEKYRTLNSIARRIIKESNVKDKTIQVQSSLELPEILIPLVDLEIGKIIRDPDRIVEALKSDDTVIFNRAIRVKWFFDGTFETVTNVTYFQDHIFNWVSVTNRLKLIKILSTHLATKKKSHIAEELYLALSDMYGSAQAEPLLCACSESFIWDEIITRRLVLSARTVENLFLKHPDVVIKYLKLNESCDKPYDRNMHEIPMQKYFSFLPRLMKNRADTFVDLIESNIGFFNKLSRKCTNRFLKKKADVLIKNSRTFGPMMDLELVSSKLTKEQFKLFFRNLFPVKISDTYSNFSFMTKYEYLKYYPNGEKVPLILSTFNEVYEKNFLEQDDLITREVLCLLSPEDREHVARRRIEKDLKWPIHCWDLEYSWRCYLPIRESIPIMKERISKSPEVEKRQELIKQMIYSCKVNNDANALLEVLKYITTRHKNERVDTLLCIMNRLMKDFETPKLSHEHWNELDKIINIMYVKDQPRSMTYGARELLHAKIHYNLIHNLPITEPIKFLCNLMKHDYTPDWNILTEHPAYERKCLIEFLEVVPPLYAQEHSMMDLVNSFLSSINNFNKRILKTGSEVEAIAIDNEWLLAQIPLYINSDEAEDMRLNLKKCDLKLYNAWVKNNENDKMINFESTEEYNEWKKNPERIAKNWEKYLQECETEIHRKCARRFIKLCRWHSNIPIKFAEKCLKNVIENRNSQALIILSILFEGPVFEHLISDFLPTISSIDIEAENAKKNYAMMQSIPEALTIVNPPVSLNVTEQLCKGDTIHMIANWLRELSRQTSVAKLIPFITAFMDQPISISKHFISIFSTAANINECHRVYMSLWRNEKHQTIRTLVFTKIFHLFVSNPNDTTWLLITECIDNLTAADEDSLKSICCPDKVPNEYIADYVRKVLMTLKKFHCVEFTDQDFIQSRISELLQLPDNVAFLFPEDLHQEILMTYFADLSWPTEISTAARYYLINAYINPALDKLESRLNIYSDMFTGILKNQWDIPHPRRLNAFPANHMVDSEMINILHDIKDHETRQKFIDMTLKTFLAVLNPLQAPSFFTFYVFASLHLHINMTTDDYANRIIEIIPTLIATFGVEFISVLGSSLGKFLELLYENHNPHEVSLDLIETLLGSQNELAILLASAIPIEKCTEFDDDRYIHILQMLRQQKNPAVVASASIQINCRGFVNI